MCNLNESLVLLRRGVSNSKVIGEHDCVCSLLRLVDILLGIKRCKKGCGNTDTTLMEMEENIEDGRLSKERN